MATKHYCDSCQSEIKETDNLCKSTINGTIPISDTTFSVSMKVWHTTDGVNSGHLCNECFYKLISNWLNLRTLGKEQSKPKTPGLTMCN
jgi:hypothetical protein